MRAVQVQGFPNAQTVCAELMMPVALGVVCQTQYSALNYKDMLAITGRGKIMRQYPMIAGIDVAGVVEKSTDIRFNKGEQVMVFGAGLGERFDGGLAEYVALPSEVVMRLPAQWSCKTAMLFGTAGFSAALAVEQLLHHDINPADGEVVVTGASGVVGLWTVRMLAYLGFDVVAVSQKVEQHGALLYRMGAQRLLDYTEFTQQAKPLASAQYVAGVDQVGGDGLVAMLASIKEHGAVCSIGMAADGAFQGSVMPFILRGVTLYGITSTNATAVRRERVMNWVCRHFDADFIEQMPYHEVMLDEVIPTCERWTEIPAGRVIVNIGALE